MKVNHPSQPLPGLGFGRPATFSRFGSEGERALPIHEHDCDIPVAEMVLAARDEELRVWMAMRRDIYRKHIRELVDAHADNTIPDLIGRWLAESLR